MPLAASAETDAIHAQRYEETYGKREFWIAMLLHYHTTAAAAVFCGGDGVGFILVRLRCYAQFGITIRY